MVRDKHIMILGNGVIQVTTTKLKTGLMYSETGVISFFSHPFIFYLLLLPFLISACSLSYCNDYIICLLRKRISLVKI